MFRSVRVLIVAAVVAVSLLGSASVASADTGARLRLRIPVAAPVVGPAPVLAPEPLPSILRDISWE